MSILPDACPSCPDGPVVPALSEEPVPGGTVTSHQCRVCGTAWEARRDTYGWVLDRLAAPVGTERQAAA